MVKNSSANAGVMKCGFESMGWEDHLEEGMATHFSIRALENPMDTAAWQAIICTVAQSQTCLKRPSTHARNDAIF